MTVDMADGYHSLYHLLRAELEDEDGVAFADDGDRFDMAG